MSSASLIQGIKSGQFFTSIPNITLFASKMNEETLELEDIFLHIYDSKQKKDKAIWANEGKILHSKNENTGIESFKLSLENGNIVNYLGDDVEKILFQDYVLPISEKRFSYRPTTKEIMMSKSELNKFIKDGLDQAIENGFDKKDYFNANYEYWNRLNTPLLCILLTFLGFCLGITGNRGRSKNSSGKAILFLIGYYVIFFGLVSVARDGNLPVYIAMLIPNAALIFVAYRSYKHLDWMS